MSTPRAIAACVLLTSLAFLSGCGESIASQGIVPERCMAIGGSRQMITVPLPVHGSGLLHVAVRERGISAEAVLASAGAERPDGDEATSPVNRLGTITLVHAAASATPMLLRIASIDSRDVIGEVCVSADLLNPIDGPQARARRLMASADVWSHRQQWQRAFDEYLAAARQFDALGMEDDAADARHVMAELAYGYMQRRRDGLALVAASIGEGTHATSAVIGARLALMAKALMELPDETELPTAAVLELLRAADRRFRSSDDAKRELPRLETYEGFVEYRGGHPDEAYRQFGEAAAQCKRLRDWECFARARQNAAAIAEERQNYPAALAAYEDALGSLDMTRMPMLGADISYNLARLEARAGLFSRSQRDQETAMRLYAQLGQCDRARRSASGLGEMLMNVGSESDAVAFLDRAATMSCAPLLASLKAASVPAAGAGDSLPGNAAGTHLDGARALLSACTRSKGVIDPTLNGNFAMFQTLLTLGEIAKSDEEFSTAAACFAAARTHSVEARTQVRLLNAIGDLQLNMRHLAAAENAFGQALHLSEAASLDSTSEYRGAAERGLAQAALSAGHGAAALKHADAALRLAISQADVTRVVASLRLLASSFAATGRRILAVRVLRSAIELTEQVPTAELDPEQRATYLATQYAVFGDLTDLLLSDAESGNADAAWRALAVAEQGHARSLRYAVELTTHEDGPGQARDGSADYRRLLRAMAATALNPQVDVGAGLLREIKELPLRYAGTDQAADRRALADRLGKMRATLVEYAAGSSDMYAFVTDGTSIHVFRLGSRATIAQASASLLGQLRAAEASPAEIRGSARELAQLVWWPIRPYLRGDRIVIVPDDALHTVPFAVLPWTSAARADMVVQHVEISSIPSALLLARATGSPQPHRARFVLLGDPVFRDNVWRRSCADPGEAHGSGDRGESLSAAFQWVRWLPSLPGSRAEVLSIGEIVRKWRHPSDVQTLLQCAATSSALRMAAPEAEVIHVATHGLVDARRPRLSALALTPDPLGPPDPAFRLFDILQLRLHARMVVLSACDTSQGRLLPGEGVLGLAQAFLQAGAQSVVASYWRVDDAAVEPFMDSFYRHLVLEGLPAATALRRAQLDRASTSDSYDWAAFSLYGRPDSRL